MRATACLCTAATPALAQPSPPFPRLNLTGTLGQALGAGNRFTDIALTGGVRIARVESRLRWGTLAYLGGCSGEFPTKCAAGDGGYLDATATVHLGGTGAAIDSWTVSAGPGIVRTGNRAFLGVAVGRDLAVGKRGVARVELHARHLFDRYYRVTWGEPHRQIGVRVGLGLWTAVERL